MKNPEIIMMSLADVKPYEKNPRKNDKAVEPVANSIREFGFKIPLVIDKDNIIVCGHTRYKAARKLGIKEVPCIKADDLTPEQVKAFRLADNKVGEIAEWDMDFLNDELAELSMDMTAFGFIEEETEKDDDAEEEPHEDDGPDEIPAVPTAKRGDIYKLGEHYLMCGDSTKQEDVEMLMQGEKADLFLTDPPYNVAIEEKNQFLKEHNTSNRNVTIKPVLNDKGMTDDQVGASLWLPAFKNALDNAKDRCTCYIFMAAGMSGFALSKKAQEAGWNIKHELIWVKNHPTFSFGRLDYDYKHEPLLYGWNKRHDFYANDRQYTIMEEEHIDVDTMTEAQAKKLLKKIYKEQEQHETTTLYENIHGKCDLHPTMKPVKLFGRLIKNSTRKCDIVLDLFGGSGTTIIACEQLKRKCRMMEYDPRYVDVIIARWEKETGKKAELIKESE